jgi:NAD-dependent SIR2 family protein deacetylase
MSSQNEDYLDGNAAAGELSNIFTMDVTTAEGQCAHCGATKRFAEAHLYMQCPGIVARCADCQHVLLRLAKAHQRVFLDMRGMTCLILDTSHVQPAERALSDS